MKNIPWFALLFFSFFSARANTYYVSATGNDANSGSSVADAWQSLSRVNSFSFSPGDSVAFEGGAVFNGRLINPSLFKGLPGNPTVVTSYGTGKATINAAAEEGISMGNASNLVISNLIITGSGYKISGYWNNGIGFYLDYSDKASDSITLDGIDVSGFGGWGINFMTTDSLDGYTNLTVVNSTFNENGLGGFIIRGPSDTVTNSRGIRHKNIYMNNCKANRNYGRSDIGWVWSGSGIYVDGFEGGIIQNCETADNGIENGCLFAGPIGLFMGECRNVTIQKCVSHHNHSGPGKKDGGGFDLDLGTYNCLIQNCESYENDGAGYGIYNLQTVNPWNYNVLRYNSSTNDARNNEISGPTLYGAFTFWGATSVYRLKTVEVYGNSIVMNKPGYAISFIASNMDSVLIHDNSFCLEGSASFLYYASETPVPEGAFIYNNSFPCTVKPQKSFITPTVYRGAFPAINSTTGLWTGGMTNYTSQTINYGVPDSIIQTNINTSITLIGTKKYVLKGPIYVGNGATLTIQAGCTIFGDKATAGSALIITQSGKIRASGASRQIVFTSNQAVGARAPGDWGGVFILGKASVNTANGTNYIGAFGQTANTLYGGGITPNDEDSSGVFQFVRIEYAGSSFGGTPLGALTLAGVGSGTTVRKIQVSYSAGDGIRWMGGAVNCRNLVGYKNAEDDWDIKEGYHGALQFMLGLRDPLFASSVRKANGVNIGEDNTVPDAKPYNGAIICNLTEIGPLRGNNTATVNSAFTYGIGIANNAKIRVLNSIVMDYPTGLFLKDGMQANALNDNYVNNATNTNPQNMVFKNNIVAGSNPGKNLATDGTWNMAEWFKKNRNDELATTDSLLYAPYKLGTNNAYAGDYRTAASSIALKNNNWSDSAFYYIDATGKTTNLIACPVTSPPPAAIIGDSSALPYVNNWPGADTAVYYLSSKNILGILRYNWTVPAGINLVAGQGTDTIAVTFNASFAGGGISVRSESYCGLISAATSFNITLKQPPIYTFAGTGNWSDTTNWLNRSVPPLGLPAWSEIVINPTTNGQCLLDVKQTLFRRSKITIKPSARLVVQGNLTHIKTL